MKKFRKNAIWMTYALIATQSCNFTIWNSSKQMYLATQVGYSSVMMTVSTMLAWVIIFGYLLSLALLYIEIADRNKRLRLRQAKPIQHNTRNVA